MRSVRAVRKLIVERIAITNAFGRKLPLLLKTTAKSESIVILWVFLWDWDVAGWPDRGYLEDNLAVLGPCIVRRPGGFGI